MNFLVAIFSGFVAGMLVGGAFDSAQMMIRCGMIGLLVTQAALHIVIHAKTGK